MSLQCDLVETAGRNLVRVVGFAMQLRCGAILKILIEPKPAGCQSTGAWADRYSEGRAIPV